MGDASRQDAGLADPGAGQNQNRAVEGLDRRRCSSLSPAR